LFQVLPLLFGNEYEEYSFQLRTTRDKTHKAIEQPKDKLSNGFSYSLSFVKELLS